MQTADGDNLVVAEQLGAVRVLTINRSDKMNAFTPALMHELDHMPDDAAWDSATRVVMITGAGQKAFVAGSDIDGLIEMNSVEAYRDMQSGQRVLFRLDQRNCQVPADHLLEQASAAIHDQPVLDGRSDGGGASGAPDPWHLRHQERVCDRAWLWGCQGAENRGKRMRNGAHDHLARTTRAMKAKRVR
ncbi:enoyl-CoA hydratase/isomerase family protein [Bradyrhizobium sp. 170]|uniref:enoyl-CoA hydratase/isomerase family protein n=1 Tax=Bradyrhizobium sp. 170 TaxID=2782641 RepID=UPI001FFFB816|nr:enoyl-CoA hydratase/isomerase family protein [Bradyrhizobium sp. 170]